MKRKPIIIKFAIITICLAGLFVYDILTGFIDIPLSEIFKYIFHPDSVSDEYFLLLKEFRFPRVIVAILAGASLSISGLLMQTIFRNPLAGPYVLGVSSGASLGVAFVVMGAGGGLLSSSISYNVITLLAAGIGSAAVLALILAVSLKVRDILSILIIGILIAGVISSIVSILQYFATDSNLKSFVVWTMGSLESVSSQDVKLITPIILVFSSLAFTFSKKLNLLLPGENFAISMGVNIKILRIISFTAVSILTGVVTAYCGPLGFVGIAVPHISRWVFNSSNHFILIPSCIIIGGIFMLGGDILSHTFTESGILPINAITSILGAPFIVWVVFRNKKTMV